MSKFARKEKTYIDIVKDYQISKGKNKCQKELK